MNSLKTYVIPEQWVVLSSRVHLPSSNHCVCVLHTTLSLGETAAVNKSVEVSPCFTVEFIFYPWLATLKLQSAMYRPLKILFVFLTSRITFQETLEDKNVDIYYTKIPRGI